MKNNKSFNEEKRSFKNKIDTFKERINKIKQFLTKSKKRILAFVLALFTFGSTFSTAIPAFALSVGNSATIESNYISAYYDTGNWTTANGNTHNNNGQVALYNIKATGEPVYCIQIYEGTSGTAGYANQEIQDTSIWHNELTNSAKSIITLATIYGYDGTSNNTYGYSATNAQLATQVIIWEAETHARTNFTTGCTSWAKSIFNNYPDALSCYNKILAACANHTNKPSFDKTSVTLTGTGESNAKTITDTNGVLSDFTATSTDSNINVSKNGNNLKIWCSANGNYSGNIVLIKNNTNVGSSLAISGTGQTKLYGKIADPISSRVSVNVQAMKCNVSVAKQDSETGAILDGASFKVQQWSHSQNRYVDYKTLTATEYNGSRRYVATDLEYTDDNRGWFKIIEVSAPAGYENDPTFIPGGSYTSTAPGEFQLTTDMSGKNFNFTVKDSPLKCNVSIAKQDSENNSVLDGAQFKVQQWSYASNKYVDYMNLTETEYNGSTRYVAKDLKVTADNGGWFNIVEVNAPAGYENNPVIISHSYTKREFIGTLFCNL